jgi:cytochrome c biogenesis protein CcdA
LSLAKVLPLSIVMIAGPQVLSAIFLATSESWKKDSAAFVAGAALSMSIVLSVALLLGLGASDQGTSDNTISFVVLGLLLLAALHTFLNRKKVSDPPKWMGKLETANPGLAFKLGFLLLGFFPSDILTSFAVAGTLVAGGENFISAIPFIVLTVFWLALPALLIVLLGPKAQAFLPKVRDWMNDNSWIVNECVLALFIALTISNLS